MDGRMHGAVTLSGASLGSTSSEPTRCAAVWPPRWEGFVATRWQHAMHTQSKSLINCILKPFCTAFSKALTNFARKRPDQMPRGQSCPLAAVACAGGARRQTMRRGRTPPNYAQGAHAAKLCPHTSVHPFARCPDNARHIICLAPPLPSGHPLSSPLTPPPSSFLLPDVVPLPTHPVHACPAQAAYKLVTEGKFTDALKAFTRMLHVIPLTVVATRKEVDDVKVRACACVCVCVCVCVWWGGRGPDWSFPWGLTIYPLPQFLSLLRLWPCVPYVTPVVLCSVVYHSVFKCKSIKG
eukprot:356142-Chlamydomonas_euryale.AAC.3